MSSQSNHGKGSESRVSARSRQSTTEDCDSPFIESSESPELELVSRSSPLDNSNMAAYTMRPCPLTNSTSANNPALYRGSSQSKAPIVGGAVSAPLSPLKLRRSTSIGQTSHTKVAPEPLLHTAHGTVYTRGRPPWYNEEGEIKEPFVIGICGGSASGKTTVARAIIEELDVDWVSLLSMDSYYREYTKAEKAHILAGQFNFDHPSAFDLDLLRSTLKRLKKGKSVQVPVYDFTTHSRVKGGDKTVYGANVVIFEGIMAFVCPEIVNLLDIKVFVETDADERLARRLRRDINERGRDLKQVLEQYARFVKPAYEQFIAPSAVHADIIVPRGGGNRVAIDLIIQHVNRELVKRGRSSRSHLLDLGTLADKSNPENLYILPETKQVRGMHTFIRCKDTTRDEFIFYSNRLMRLLCEFAMSMLPFTDVSVNSPQNCVYYGKRCAVAGGNLVGVSVLRAGETLEPALCAVAKGVRLGKILIQTNPETQEPELHYLRLPRDIHDCHVVVMDATVATGAAALMAIRVLLEHDVPEENITLVSILMAAQGAYSLAYTHPKLRIVTTAVDTKLDDNYHIIPGIGNFGDRYFGTDFGCETCDSD